MDIQKYLMKARKNQKDILDCIENESENEIFLDKIKDIKENLDNQFELVEFLHSLLKISDDHHRSQSFFSKIESIISFFKEDIQKNFSNFEIFNIFKSNKRILLFLFKEKFIIPDFRIYDYLKNNGYQQKNYFSYFYPEFKSFFDESEKQKFFYEENESFENNRKIGENNSHICYLIRNDLISEFISLINMNNYSINSKLNSSIFETNSFLLNKKPTLIEYSAFFGSIQVFRYLTMNNADLNSSLWIYAIHGQNPEIIHFLEDNKVKLINSNECLFESIKCHHIEFANYIKDNLLNTQDEEDLCDLLNSDKSYIIQKKLDDEFQFFLKCLKSFNYFYLQQDCLLDESVFYYLCKYDYCYLVQLLINNQKIDINRKKILKCFCFLISFLYCFYINKIPNFRCFE